VGVYENFTIYSII